MIISESNSLKIFSFIKSSKMTTLISFFSFVMLFAVQYIMLMFASKSSEALHFDEHNIIEFFKRFKKLCDEYKITVKKQWVKLSRYCERSIIEFMKTLTSYVNRNWIVFNKKMQKKYKNKNAKQMINFRFFLKKYKSKTRIDD